MKILYAQWVDKNIGHDCSVFNKSWCVGWKTTLRTSADDWKEGTSLSLGVNNGRWFAYGVADLPEGEHEYKLCMRSCDPGLSAEMWFNDASGRPLRGPFQNQLWRVEAADTQRTAAQLNTIPRFFEQVVARKTIANLAADLGMPHDVESQCEMKPCSTKWMKDGGFIFCRYARHIFHERCFKEHLGDHDGTDSGLQVESSCPVCGDRKMYYRFVTQDPGYPLELYPRRSSPSNLDIWNIAHRFG